MVVTKPILGMSGQSTMIIELGSLEDDAVITDVVYTPLITYILAHAMDRGLKTTGGRAIFLSGPKFCVLFLPQSKFIQGSTRLFFN